MSSVRKSAVSTENGRAFPKEAYDFHDDVTKEAVDKVREKAEPMIKGDDWEVVDGFGYRSR
jgi:hypothetical protein